MEQGTEEKAWKRVQNKSRFVHAFRGLYIFLKTTRNAKIHIFLGILAIILGCYLNISYTEWISLVLVIGLVFISEAFNTAIEIDIDLTSPEYHPYARDTKDVAAGAVLIGAVIALIVGFLIFVPKMLNMLQL